MRSPLQRLASHLRNCAVRTRQCARAMALSREPTILPAVCSGKTSRGVTQFHPRHRHRIGRIGDIGAAGGGHTGLRRHGRVYRGQAGTAVPHLGHIAAASSAGRGGISSLGDQGCDLGSVISSASAPIVPSDVAFPQASRQSTHSITSSARARIDGGTVRPRALAVFRLTTSSNFVGCWTGRSAGLAPLRIFPT